MSDGLFRKDGISAKFARRLIDAAVAKAEDIEVAMSIAVVDESGVLTAFLRMDGAALLSVKVSEDKAYTAAGFGLATHEWFDFIKDDAPLLYGAPPSIDRLVVFGGGFPVTIGGSIVGGIGVSGGHWRQDMEVAEAALATVIGNTT